MIVKELIEALKEHPQNAIVCYFKDEGLCEAAKVKKAFSGNDETKEIVGDEFVLIE